MPKRVETIKLTEEMFLDLMRGKDLWLTLNAQDKDKEIQFRFRGPLDGVFLTHEEISNIQYQTEMGIMNVMERISNNKVVKHDVTAEKK